MFLTKIFASFEQQSVTRFDVLDGFRGLLVISVILQHIVAVFAWGRLNEFYHNFDYVGTYFGVPSFFILSSFLLTYKLFETMNKSNGTLVQLQTIILKYLIRRFFRIYVPYFIFCTLLSNDLLFSKKGGFTYDSWFNMISLKNTGRNHLWTCIPEMKYYLFIPFLTLIVYKTQKVIIIWIALYIIISAYIEHNNWINLKCVHIPWPNGISLRYSIRIFLNGSVLALIFYKYKQFKNKKIVTSRSLEFLVTIALTIMFIYGLMLTTASYMGQDIVYFCHYKYSIYWACFIILLLLHPKSLFSFIINLLIFKNFGKFSFGIYLLHFEALNVIYLIENTKIMEYRPVVMIIQLFSAFLFGKIFFYLIENPLMNLGNLIIRHLPEQSNDNIHVFQKNSNFLIKHLSTISIFIFLFLFYFFSCNYFSF